jgi:hypothetical protein
MTSEWAVIKFTRDLRRQEPINVGVVLLSDRGHRLRVRGLAPDGTLAGRWSGNVSNLRAWIDYLTWQISQPLDGLGELLHTRVGDSYSIVEGGHILTGEDPDPDVLVEQLYGDLVARSDEEEGAPDFKQQVENLVDASGLSQDEHFRRRLPVRTQEGEMVEFPYAWVNGHMSVAQLMPSMRIDQVHSTLWICRTLPGDVIKLVFTESIPDDRSRAAEILESEASLIEVPTADPADVRARFMSSTAN